MINIVQRKWRAVLMNMNENIFINIQGDTELIEQTLNNGIVSLFSTEHNSRNSHIQSYSVKYTGYLTGTEPDFQFITYLNGIFIHIQIFVLNYILCILMQKLVQTIINKDILLKFPTCSALFKMW